MTMTEFRRRVGLLPEITVLGSNLRLEYLPDRCNITNFEDADERH